MENKSKSKGGRRLSIAEILDITHSKDQMPSGGAGYGSYLASKNFGLKNEVSASKKLKLDLKGIVSDKFYNEVVENMNDDNLKELKKLLDFSK